MSGLLKYIPTVGGESHTSANVVIVIDKECRME